MTQELLLLEEICPILHIGKSTAYKMIQSGLLSANKIGGKWQIRYEDLEKYLNNLSTTQKQTLDNNVNTYA